MQSSSDILHSIDLQNLVFLLLNIFTRFGIEVGMSKQLPAPTITKDHPVSAICKILGVNSCNILLELFPIISLAFVAYIMLKCLYRAICQRFLKYFLLCGTMVSYLSIAFHWASETTLFSHAGTVQEFGRSLAPRIVYAIGGLSLATSAFSRIFGPTVHLKMNKRIIILLALMLCSWSPTILILLGRQGPFVALICMAGGNVEITRLPMKNIDLHDEGTVQIFWPLNFLLPSLFCSLVYRKIATETSERVRTLCC